MQYVRAWINWVDWQSQLIQFTNRKVVLVIFTKEQKSEVRYGTVRYGTVRYGTVRYGTVRYGTVRYGTVRYGTVRYAFEVTYIEKQTINVDAQTLPTAFGRGGKNRNS